MIRYCFQRLWRCKLRGRTYSVNKQDAIFGGATSPSTWYHVLLGLRDAFVTQGVWLLTAWWYSTQRSGTNTATVLLRSITIRVITLILSYTEIPRIQAYGVGCDRFSSPSVDNTPGSCTTEPPPQLSHATNTAKGYSSEYATGYSSADGYAHMGRSVCDTNIALHISGQTQVETLYLVVHTLQKNMYGVDRQKIDVDYLLYDIML